jgi:hypothetical protein
MTLTIAYLTNRKNPRLRWFFDSLHRETGGNYTGIRVVVVDYWFHDRCNVWPEAHDVAAWADRIIKAGGDYFHGSPKPSVWQGPHRLTTRDYFAASNARNTALCLAPDGFIAYVDDLSVLMPGWLTAVRDAMAGNYVVLGAYKKQKQLVVENGEVQSFEEFPAGVDSRWGRGRDDGPVVAAGSWLFGCSVAGPVEAWLRINGWDEDNDSMGGEDYACGIMLERAGYQIRYDRRMLTYESEEAHHEERPFLRVIKKHRGANAACPDASHWMLQAVMRDRHRAPNYFGPEGIRGVRAQVLAGEPFPITQIPQHHWPDGQPLSEM